MLTKTEIRLLDRYLSIHERYVDKPVFYNALTNIVPTYRAEELYENDAYEQYLETLINDNNDIQISSKSVC